MARITEPMKIERIKKAVMQIMCENGYNNTSIALISKKSGISSGYLYRYYSGKDELIQDIIESNSEEIKSKILHRSKPYKTVYEYLFNIIDRLFETANSDPILGKFIAKLSLDTNIPKWAEEKKDMEMFDVINEMLSLGKKTGEINAQCNKDDIELAFFTLPFRYIVLELNKNENKKFSKKEVIKLTDMCMKAVG